MALLATILAGCDDAPAPINVRSQRKIEVLATVYPMADLAKQVGGDAVNVQWLAETPTHPTSIFETTDLIQRANGADLVVTSGPWDAWAWREVAQEAWQQHLIQPQFMPSAHKADARSYLWLDPDVAQEVVDAMSRRLAQGDPASNGAIRSAVAGLRQQFEDLDRDFRAALRPRDGSKVLSVRPVWRAMLARYNLTLISPVEVEEERLSEADMKKLAKTAKESGVKSLLIDAATPLAVRQRIMEGTGLRLVPLDALGTSAPAGRSTYIRLMRFNLESLKGYW